MTNALTIYGEFDTMQRAAVAMFESGYFGDTKSKAQAIVKVMAGSELGLPPFASMSGIHIVQGKPVIGANLIATLVKNSGRYDYRVKQADNTACVLTWYEHGKPVGESSFTRKEAADGNVDKSWDKDTKAWKEKVTWKAYPSDMLFARAISRGARRYAPGIFGGAPVYTPDEMGVDTDEEGYVIEGVAVEVTPAPQPQPTRNGKARPVEEETHGTFILTTDPGPLPDDELAISEVDGTKFIVNAAALIGVDVEEVTARLKALGYKGVPGDKQKRLDAYRKLKTAAPVANGVQ